MRRGGRKSARSSWPIPDEDTGGHELVAGMGSLSDRKRLRINSLVCSRSAPDTELMQWAAERDYVVLAADLDFGAILAATRRSKPSVVQVRSNLLTLDAIGAIVVAALRQSRQELLDGALISVDATRARLRILPLRQPGP